MRLQLASVVIGLTLGACGSEPEMATSEPPSEQLDGVEATAFNGPGLVCGLGFAIELKDGEELTRFDRQMDFITYRLMADQKAAVIYVGDYPMEAHVTINTGKEFPSKVAIHLDSRGYTEALAERILVASDFPSICPKYVD